MEASPREGVLSTPAVHWTVDFPTEAAMAADPMAADPMAVHSTAADPMAVHTMEARPTQATTRVGRQPTPVLLPTGAVWLETKT